MTPTACSRTFSRHRLWLLRFSSPRYLFKRPCLFKRNCFRIFWPENHPMHCSPFKNTSTNCSSSLYKRGLQKPFRGNQTWKIGHSIFYKQSWRKSKYKAVEKLPREKSIGWKRNYITLFINHSPQKVTFRKLHLPQSSLTLCTSSYFPVEILTVSELTFCLTARLTA